MNLLCYEYFPSPLSEGPYRSWSSTISPEGVLQQHISSHDFARCRDAEVDARIRDLTVEEFARVEQLLTEFPPNYSEDFTNIAIVIEDAPIVRIDSDVYPVSVSGPLHSFSYMHRRGELTGPEHFDFGLIMNLWSFVDGLQFVRAR